MKSHARVVVVGGGVMGVALLYHLTEEGWSDVGLVEKGELTSGSTWHAAGLIPHFIASLNMAKVNLYGSPLYQRLEAETGQATGWHGCGAIRLATNDDEVDWFHYVQGVLRCVGAECHLIGPAEIARLHPLLDTDGVVLGAYTPGDGHTDPASSTNAMAAGARARGAEITLRNRVIDIARRRDGSWEVTTEQGSIVAEHVVNAAGGFAPRIGAMVGLQVLIVNVVHQYLVTDKMAAVAALEREPPVVRDPRASCYYRQEQQGLIVGPYETAGSQAWALDGIDWSFDTELLPPDIDRLTPWLELAAERIPAFAEAGIKRVVSGPITHTPDGGFLLGPAAGLTNFWMCCGAGIGITQGPGAGKALDEYHHMAPLRIGELPEDSGLTRLSPAPAMPEPRFSGSSTLQLSYFRHKTVPRRSPSPSIVTRPPRDAPVGPGGACCRRGSSTRSAPSPAPARHYVPASRPCRCSGPRRHARRGPEPTNGSCCLASRARSAACCGGPCDGSGSATPSPSAPPRSPPSGKRCPPTHPKPCCPHPGYRRGLGCRAPPRRSHDSETKALDEYHHMYQVHFPGEFREPGRPVNTTPIYATLAARGAVFAEAFGWERPKWFAGEGVEERYGFRRTNVFAPVAEECKAVRERVGVLDLSTFAKFDVTGRDATAFLERVIANRVPRRDGRVILAHALTDRLAASSHPRPRAHRAWRHRVRIHGDAA